MSQAWRGAGGQGLVQGDPRGSASQPGHVWGRMIRYFCAVGLLCARRLPSSIPGVYLLDANGTKPPRQTTKNCPEIANCPQAEDGCEWAKSAPLGKVPHVSGPPSTGSCVRRGRPVQMLPITFLTVWKLINILRVKECGNLFWQRFEFCHHFALNTLKLASLYQCGAQQCTQHSWWAFQHRVGEKPLPPWTYIPCLC